MKDSPIFITGVPRSGTSLIAEIIYSHGAWGGDMVGPTRDNPRGFFENKHLRQNILKPLLRSMGADSLGQDPLPKQEKFPSVNSARHLVLKSIAKQGYKDGPWFYKDSKLALVWLIFFNAFPDAKWVLVRRDTNAIANSCMRTSFMRARNTHKEWVDWVRDYESYFTLRDLVTCIEVWPQRIIQGNIPEALKMLEFIELPGVVERIKEVIHPEFWNAGTKIQSLNTRRNGFNVLADKKS